MNFLICTPFTGQTSERGIIMRYSFEFKLECVKMYECGECHSKKLRELRLKEDKEQKDKRQKMTFVFRLLTKIPKYQASIDVMVFFFKKNKP